MMIKYRVSEVAKDFGVPTKEVTELLARYFDTPKKSMTALEEQELDIVFESLTQSHQVESFDEYFATAAEKEPAKPAAPQGGSYRPYEGRKGGAETGSSQGGCPVQARCPCSQGGGPQAEAARTAQGADRAPHRGYPHAPGECGQVR